MIRNFFRNLFGSGEASQVVARSRLQLVLVQDRTGLSNEEMLSFKREMMGVIEKYFVVNAEGFDISYRREGDSTTLLINSPVVVKRIGDGAGRAAMNGAPNASQNNLNKKNKHNKHHHGQQPNR